MTDLSVDMRAALRANAERFLARFYRHELLLARTVRGMQIEAQQEFDRDIARPLLKLIGGELSTFRLRGQDIVAAAYPQLAALEREIDRIVRQGSSAVQSLTIDRIGELISDESEWLADVVRNDLGVEPRQPTVATEQSVLERPWLGMRTEEWFGKMLVGPAADKTRAWVQTGIQRGLTTDEIVRGLKGTRDQVGILEEPRHAVAALVRTSATHASSQTRQESFAELGLDKWQFVATLDSRTSKQCAVNDGKVFDTGKGPVPPLHPNCRSTAVPYIPGLEGTRASVDGPVPIGTKFRQWIGDQPAAVQNKVFGASVAEAWRAGKLTIDQMIGKDLQPLTLQELKLDRS